MSLSTTDSQTEGTDLWLPGRRDVGMNGLGVWDWHM